MIKASLIGVLSSAICAVQSQHNVGASYGILGHATIHIRLPERFYSIMGNKVVVILQVSRKEVWNDTAWTSSSQ